jgi:O-methyltransferase
MNKEDLQKLIQDTESEIFQGAVRVGVIGLSATATSLLITIDAKGLLPAIVGVYLSTGPEKKKGLSAIKGIPVRPLSALKDDRPDVLVIAADGEKEQLIERALPYIQGCPKIIVAGYGHYAFRDELFTTIQAGLLAPSLANGYRNSLIHLYQCLLNSARLGLEGVVAEFGMYKGGTTMFIATLLERLKVDWRVLAFDSFSGFPPKRSPLDMYDHPGCVYTDVNAVRHYVSEKRVELVVGDITETCTRLAHEDIVVSFIDTDNYSPARAALEIVSERTVLNGAIVFDHFTGENRFRYTLGERMAAKVLLRDRRYFNLHGTGVFIRQR